MELNFLGRSLPFRYPRPILSPSFLTFSPILLLFLLSFSSILEKNYRSASHWKRTQIVVNAYMHILHACIYMYAYMYIFEYVFEQIRSHKIVRISHRCKWWFVIPFGDVSWQEFCCVVDKQSRGGGGKKMSLDVSSRARCCMRLGGTLLVDLNTGTFWLSSLPFLRRCWNIFGSWTVRG